MALKGVPICARNVCPFSFHTFYHLKMIKKLPLFQINYLQINIDFSDIIYTEKNN